MGRNGLRGERSIVIDSNVVVYDFVPHDTYCVEQNWFQILSFVDSALEDLVPSKLVFVRVSFNQSPGERVRPVLEGVSVIGSNAVDSSLKFIRP